MWSSKVENFKVGIRFCSSFVTQDSKVGLLLQEETRMAVKETEKLKVNVEEQLERLVNQLDDLEKYK